jgi:hypothetical protein
MHISQNKLCGMPWQHRTLEDYTSASDRLHAMHIISTNIKYYVTKNNNNNIHNNIHNNI